MKRILLLCSAFLPAIASAQETPTYWQDIRLLFRKHCTVCHSAKNLKEADVSGGLALDSFEAVKKGIDGTPILKPGKADESLLLRVLTTTNIKRRMPLDAPPLPKESIDLVRRWIEKGANEGTAPSDMPDPMIAKSSTARKLDIVLSTDAALGKAKVDLSLKIGPLAPVTAVAFSPDGKWLAAGSYGQVAVWDVQKGQFAKLLTSVLGAVNDLKFSLDGKLLAASGGQPSAKGDLRLFHTSDWKLAGVLRGHDDVVFTVAFSADSKQLASASFDHTATLWDVAKREPIKTFSNHSDFVYGVALSPSGKHLYTASKDRTIQMVDITTGKSVFTFSGLEQDIMTVTASPDGKTVISSGLESSLYWWNPLTGERLKTTGGHGGGTYEVAFSKDGTRLISAGADRTMKLHDATEGTLLKSFPVGSSVYACALSADNKLAASGSFDGLTRVWDTASGRLLVTLVALPGEKDRPQWLALTPQGYVAAAEALVTQGKWQSTGKALAGNPWTTLHQPQDVAKAFRAEPLANAVLETK
jgi:WD40 repeat protein